MLLCDSGASLDDCDLVDWYENTRIVPACFLSVVWVEEGLQLLLLWRQVFIDIVMAPTGFIDAKQPRHLVTDLLVIEINFQQGV